jgi:mannose-6-phosphate isomerase
MSAGIGPRAAGTILLRFDRRPPRGRPPSKGSMQQILPLRGTIQHYEWGSRTALAELLGRPVPSTLPEAELWLGAHARGPAEVRVDGRWERLDALIERAGEALLGPAAEPFGRRLPFLLKVLAVERSLSLQAHPDADQARAGFDREATRSGNGAPRLYADPYAKPELVCALTPFRALCGLRPISEVRARLAELGVAALLPAAAEDDDDGVDASLVLRSWLGAGAATRARALDAAVAAARAAAARDPACACLLALADEHPGDPGVLAPVFLHLVELAPGEALFLPPGELHCYLGGTAVELMASSDNVLRGGLTRKPVDVDELLRIVSSASRRPEVLRAELRGTGLAVWRTPAREFELSLLTPRPGAPVAITERAGIEVLWCAEGALEVASSAGEVLPLGRGESCVVPAAVGAYRVAGAGRVFRAGLPAPTASRAGAATRRAGRACAS